MKTGLARKLAIVLLLLATVLSTGAPAFTEDTVSPTIYFRPGVRFGSDDRIISTFDFLVPFYQGEKNILFFNPRYSLDNRDGSEVNLGFGYRHLLFADHAVLGVNGYYDCRWTGWGTRHEQVGLGAEVMTNWVTGRFNGYFPVTGPQIGPVSGPTGYYFRDVGIYLGTGSLEETLGGFDGEVGFKVPYLSRYLETWVYAGGYHFEGDYVRDVNGFSSRVEVVPTDFLRLGFEYRNDTMNGDQYFGEAAVTVPFSIDNLVKGKNPFEGIGKHLGGDRTLKDRLTEPVRRDVDVQLHNAGSGPNLPGTETLVDGVVFVSEGAADGAGTGTFEDPFPTVGDAALAIASGGMYSGITEIHVMNDTASDVVYGGTVNVAGLWIWGSGMPHPTYGYITNQSPGNPDIYELLITADGVEVFGNSFVGTTTGMTTSGSGTYVHDNYFTAATGLTVSGGSSTIIDNIFSGTYGVYTDGGLSTITDNTFGGTYGIYTNSGTSTVTGNTFTGTYGAYTAGGTANISDNTFSSTYGVYTAGGLSTITDNTFTGTYGAYTAGGTADISDNIFNSGYGVYTTGGTSTIDANTFTGTYGVYGTGGTVSVTDNDFLGNTYGIYADGGDFTITGNTIGSAANPITNTGIYLGEALGASTITGNTIIVDNAGTNTYGIASYVAHLVLGANDITVTSGLTAYGIYGYSDTADLTGSITGGTITAAGGTSAYGAYLETAGGSIGSSTSPFTVSGATISASGTGDTYGLSLSTGGDLHGSVVDSDITGTSTSGTGYGIYEYASSVINGSITGGSATGSGNTAYGIYLRTYYGSIGSSTTPFAISGVTVNAAGTGGDAYGIWEYSQEDSLYGSINGGTITASGNSAYGISLTTHDGSVGSSTSLFAISDMTINATGTDDTYGLSLTANNGNIYSLLTDNAITGTSVSGVGFGIYEYALSAINGSITGGTITASGGNAYGTYLYSDGGSIGSSASPFTITGVSIDATGTGSTDATYGIFSYAGGGDIYTSLLDNIIAATAENSYAVGIYEDAAHGMYGGISGGSVTANGLAAEAVIVRGEDTVGDSTSPFTISGVTIGATGAGGAGTYGVKFYSAGYLYTSIVESSITVMSAGIGAGYGVSESGYNGIFGNISDSTITATASGNEAYGISLSSYHGSIGSSTSPFTVSGTTIDASGTGDTYGILLTTNNGDIYSLLTDNAVTGTSTSGTVYGVYGLAFGDIFGSIMGGTITATGGTSAYGAYLAAGGGSIGSSGSPFTVFGVTIDASGTGDTWGLYLSTGGDLYGSVANSDITGTSVSGIGYGIYEYASSVINGSITGGTVTAAGGTDAYGIYLRTYYGSIGSSTTPFAISGVTVNAAGTSGTGYGIWEYSQEDSLYGSITGGSITASGNSAYGISLTTHDGSVGGSTSLFAISDMTINATGTNDTYGLLLSTGGDLYGSVIDSDITGTSTGGVGYGIYEYASSGIFGSITGGTIAAGGSTAFGAWLKAAGGSIGSSTSPFTVYGATINASGTDETYGLYLSAVNLYEAISNSHITGTSTGGAGYGIYGYASSGIFGSITGGTITAGGTNADGAYLLANGGPIGSVSNAFTVFGVTIDVNGTDSAAGLALLAAGDIYSAITETEVTGTSVSGAGYGIYEFARGSLFGGISTGTVTVQGLGATGVHLEAGGSIGSSTSPFSISRLMIDANGTTGTGFGIYGRASNNLFGSISGGSITASGTYAYGAYLEATSGSIGSFASPFTVSGATIDASGVGDTYGLYLITGGDLYGSVIDSDITGTSGSGTGYGIYEYASSVINGSITGGTVTGIGNTAYGIYLRTYYGAIGSTTNPFTVSGVAVGARGTGGAAYGIWEYSQEGDLYGLINGGSITATGTTAYGAYVYSNDGGIGASGSPFTVSGVTINATGTGGDAYGIWEYTNVADLYGLITGGSITAIGNNAYGIHIETYSGSIGASGSPFTVSDATISATGTGGDAYGTYMMGHYLYGSITGGSVVARGSEAYGVFFSGVDIGDATNPLMISDVTIDATGTDGDAYGIYFVGGLHIYGSITGADVTATGENAYGIDVKDSWLMALSSTLAVSDTVIEATGTNGDAYGIYEDGRILAGSITGGSITASGHAAYGAYLWTTSDSIGSSTSPFTVSGTAIAATGTSGTACGIDLVSSGSIYALVGDAIVNASGTGDTWGLSLTAATDLDADILGSNAITGTSSGGVGYGIYGYAGSGSLTGSITGGSITANGHTAYGVVLETGSGSIGSASDPFTLSGATITATGNTYARGLYLNAADSFSLEISGGLVSATGNNGSARGIYGSAVNDITFSISNGTIEATGTSGNVYGIGLTAGGDLYGSIANSDITGTSGSDIGYGIYEYASSIISGSITGGTITAAGGTDTYGAYIYSLGDIGASGSPFVVSGVTIDAAGTGYDIYNCTSGLYLGAKGVYSSVIDSDITATSVYVAAYGIYEYASSVIDGSITGGTITAAGPYNAYGVYLGSNSGTIGSAAHPFTITGAAIDVTGTGGWYAYGIYSQSDSGTTYTLFADNTITATAVDGLAIGIRELGSYVYGGISGGSITSSGYGAEGIYLIAGAELGSSASPFSISGVAIDVTGTEGFACGIDEYAAGSGNLFGSITDDSIVATSGANAYGVYLYTSNGSIGSSTSPFTISGTTIDAVGTGVDNTYGLYVDTGGDFYGSIVDSDITGTSSTGTGYGIYEYVAGSLLGSITGGSITATGNKAYGAYLVGSAGTSTRPFTVSGVTIDASGTGDTCGLYLTTGGTIYSSVVNSDITGTSSWGIGYGIYEYASLAIDGSITGGTITASGRDDAYGVYLETNSGTIGTEASPFEISGVTINATGTRGVAYGIWEYSEEGSINGSITGGSITTSARYTSMGIDIVGGSIGSSTNPFTVSGVTIDATATGGGGADGIRTEASVGDLYALFEDNTITVKAVNGGATGIYGYAANIIYGEVYGGSITSNAISALGIDLRGQYSIGTPASPFVISGVTIDAAGTGSAYGIYEYSQYGSLFGFIDGGSITAGNAATYGYGVYLNAGYGTIGNAADPFTISDITIGVTGSVERYLLYLYSRAAGTGNEVDWSTISYDGSGIWTGNYLNAMTTPLDLSVLPTGTTLPVWTNFLSGDTITP